MFIPDPGCLSRIPDPDFYPSRIQDLGSRIQNQEQKRGVNKNLLYLFCGHKFHKMVNYFIFEMLKKKIANFQRIIELFTQKFVTKLPKIWVWDPGSGKNLFRIPDPGVKRAPDPGSGSATLLSRRVRYRAWYLVGTLLVHICTKISYLVKVGSGILINLGCFCHQSTRVPVP
jgi:hypothetical protein